MEDKIQTLAYATKNKWWTRKRKLTALALAVAGLIGTATNHEIHERIGKASGDPCWTYKLRDSRVPLWDVRTTHSNTHINASLFLGRDIYQAGVGIGTCVGNQLNAYATHRKGYGKFTTTTSLNFKTLKF